MSRARHNRCYVPRLLRRGAFALLSVALVPVPAALGAVLPGCERVSLGSSATQLADASYASSLSSFGRIVAYQSARGSGSARDVLDVYVRDLTTGISERVSRSSTGANGDADSVGGSLSADGRLVAFQSLASDLVTGDGNAAWDVFVRDRAAKRTTRVSVSSAGAEGDGASYAPVISADGSVVAFASAAESLVPGTRVEVN
jgi:Tol biopolymer transport system component